LLDSAAFIEDELKEETGLDIPIPVDKPDSDILYIPSSADFFTNVETMMGAAKVFYVLRADWTISSEVLESANFGLLFNLNVMREHSQRMKKAAIELGVERVIQGECGHGWRAAVSHTDTASGPVSFRLEHILQYTADQLPRLPLRKLPLRVALHDPCNYARGGGLIEQPRAILRECVEELVEMAPNREETFCCGGGSGILMDEMLDVRMKLGRKKAEQVASLGKIDYLAAPCSICKAQLPPLLQHFGIKPLEIGGLMDLVGRALELPKPPAPTAAGE
jgi:Fe-S oxidoreductase